MCFPIYICVCVYKVSFDPHGNPVMMHNWNSYPHLTREEIECIRLPS